ncbi:MAG: cell wall hydrolase [Clostridiales bacterium]|jgi:N-acetylmuramoyl-L-alanine amidase|nr:cell wall hydrolase [Clostridiales bacterium]
MLIVADVLCGLYTSVYAVESEQEPRPKIVLDGKYLRGAEYKTQDGQQLLPLRYVCESLGATVVWDTNAKRALVKFNGKSENYQGEIVNEIMYAPHDFFIKMFDAKIKSFTPVNIVAINTNVRKQTQKLAVRALANYADYTEEDLEWLSKIIEAEAGNESYASRLGVANVIINRVNNDYYPSTIREVIFDSKYGVQFTPTANGAVYNDPSSLSILAAIDALEGRNNVDKALFFMNPKIATTSWISNNRKYAFTIGGHSYYY